MVTPGGAQPGGVVVFLGPSLPLDEARAQLPGARFLPPVAQGDVLDLLLGPAPRPAAIAIIDGFFDSVPAVWHKEVLAALEVGVAVYGGGSMGALRAAELHPFGMVGVGEVFERFADGTLVDDDEVAVFHTVEPAEDHGDPVYRCVSDAMVDIRDATEASVAEGILDDALADAVVAEAKALHFRDRTHRLAARRAAARLPEGDDEGPARLDAYVAFATARPGRKARDARLVLERLADDAAGGWDRPAQPEAVTRTAYLEALRREVLLARLGADDPARLAAERETVAVARKKALLRQLARAEAERQGWEVTASELTDMVVTFRLQHGLTGPDDLARWMHDEGLSEGQLERFLVDACLVERLERLHEWELTDDLVVQLAVAGAKTWHRRRADVADQPS